MRLPVFVRVKMIILSKLQIVKNKQKRKNTYAQNTSRDIICRDRF